jgi:hypothetical protein
MRRLSMVRNVALKVVDEGGMSMTIGGVMLYDYVSYPSLLSFLSLPYIFSMKANTIRDSLFDFCP